MKRLWSVNARMINQDRAKYTQLHKKAVVYIYKAKKANAYTITEEGDLLFKSENAPRFHNSYGFFPKNGGWDDPFQPVSAEMTAEMFGEFLKSIGFVEEIEI